MGSVDIPVCENTLTGGADIPVCEKITPRRDLSVQFDFQVAVSPVNDPPYWTDVPVEDIVVDEYRRGGITTSAKDAVDRALDNLQGRGRR